MFDTRVLKQEPQQLGFDATPQDRQLVKAKRGKMREIPTNVYVDVFMTLIEDATIPEVLCLDTKRKPVRCSNIVAGKVRLDRLQELIDDQGVIAVDEADRTRFSPPPLIVSNYANNYASTTDLQRLRTTLDRLSVQGAVPRVCA